MIDIILEIFRAIIVGSIVFGLIRYRKMYEISEIDGWSYIVAGFTLIFFGTVIDITDNFDILNKYIIIGDTNMQALLEKLFGYLVGFVLLTVGILKWIPKVVKHAEQAKKNLEKTENELKVLSGLFPICANCKKIRDDKGYWNQIESYIEMHSEAKFSHSICEKCTEEIYGDEDWYKKQQNKLEPINLADASNCISGIGKSDKVVREKTLE